ncbi:hypothetical protein ACJ6TS_00515 [Citrobacter telavivensis]
MLENNNLLNVKSQMSSWMTIKEAVYILNKKKDNIITACDIYRSALCGIMNLSIYFQSPIFFRKLRTSVNKPKLLLVNDSFVNRLCFLEGECFLKGNYFIFSTTGKYIHSTHRVIDTALSGYEYVLIQHLLSKSLRLPLPLIGARDTNYGITVNVANDTFQIFEKITWEERINKQIKLLPNNIRPYFQSYLKSKKTTQYRSKEYFPVYTLPQDACFVIRHTELEKLMNCNLKYDLPQVSPTRISTPLSRLFWLACKNNESISPLIMQPYKLLSIFEQWASDEGMTDRFSGDTLKTALERGSPSSIKVPN